MPTSAKTSAAPTPDQPNAAFEWDASMPSVFEWYENRIQRDLQMLHQEDRPQRQKIVEVMEELSDSSLFWKLFSKFTDVYDQDKTADSVLAFAARIYIAGSHRGSKVLDA